jgi:AcrR family transcriptional regulator
VDRPSGEARERLLEAAGEIFGTHNLEGATTRQIAGRAGVNQAAIAYYFGGKEGLYEAVIQQFLATNFSPIRPVVFEIRKHLASGAPGKKEALALLKQLLGVMLETVLTRGAHSTWARIVMREQMQPTPAFDLLYERAVRLVHETVSTLVGAILGQPATDPKVILRAHMLVGQVLIFLSGQATIKRRLGLAGYSESEVALIKEVLSDQIDLLRVEMEAEP